jgi:hypothetical protein
MIYKMENLTEEQQKAIAQCYEILEAVGLGTVSIGAPYPKPKRP